LLQLSFLSSLPILTSIALVLDEKAFWYRPEERSIRVALILASATLAGAFGGALATGISYMNGVGGIQAYRWLVSQRRVRSTCTVIVYLSLSLLLSLTLSLSLKAFPVS
jgi:hypothetical protein